MMTIHFICRGNALRSIIAETYLNAQKLKDVHVMSSGTVAAANRDENLQNYLQTVELLRRHNLQDFIKPGYGEQLTQERLARADTTICMNDVVVDECKGLNLPADTIVWNVADIGEGRRQLTPNAPRESYLEDVYADVTGAVTALVETYHLK